MARLIQLPNATPTPVVASRFPSRRTAALGRRRRAGELALEPDEERLEGQPRLELELLVEAPRLADGFRGRLRTRKPLDTRVLAQLVEPIDMRRGRLGPRGDDDEVAVPRLELLEAKQDLLALGAAHRPPRPLLLLATRKVELLVLRLRTLLGLLGPLAGDLHQPTRCLTRLEPGLAIDGARDLEHRLAPLSSLGIEQPVDPVEPPASHPRECGRLVLRQLRRASDDLGANRRLGKPPERNELTARADRVRQRTDVVCDEHRHGVRRRLLEILEQRIGRLV